MKALFGAVSLLIVLAIVGLLAVRQLHAVGAGLGSASTQDGQSPVAASTASGGGNVREQAVRLENQVANDVRKALDQGAHAHDEAAEK